ncbi:MAG: hypothetical protein ACOCXC_02985 [Fibrobacterota bacterium]
MKSKICAVICVLVLSMAGFAQQKAADSNKTAESDTASVIQKAEASPKQLSKQTSIYRPKTVTNWSKIKDLFK